MALEASGGERLPYTGWRTVARLPSRLAVALNRGDRPHFDDKFGEETGGNIGNSSQAFLFVWTILAFGHHGDVLRHLIGEHC